MAFEFKLPDIGEGIHEGEIVEWLVKVGDFVKEDQPIVEVMTDKVTAEIPAPVSGTIQELRGKAGEVIKVGSVIAVFDEKAGEEKTSGKASATTAKATEAATPATNGIHGKPAAKTATLDRTASQTSGGKVLAAPATRKLARQMGVDLALIAGSGPRGRITQDDVRQGSGGSHPTTATRPAAASLMGRPGEFRSAGERRAPFAGLRRKIAEHLVKSKQTAPHFAYVEEVDMTRLVQIREELLPLAEEQGVKLSYLPFMIKATIAGLRKFPVLNSQLDEAANELVYKNDFHMGVAVATDQGLVVPVIKFADQKSLFALAQEIVDLANKARSGKLSLDDMRGGTFTLTSIGSIGGLFGVPIINYPEVAIMGVNKIEKRPVVRDNQIVIRDIMHLSISCDHRVVDGAEAALFVKEVIQNLENPTRLLISEGL